MGLLTSECRLQPLVFWSQVNADHELNRALVTVQSSDVQKECIVWIIEVFLFFVS